MNYPEGTGPNDPKAPWNAREPKMSEWDGCQFYTCRKCYEAKGVDDQLVCKECFEPQEIPEEVPEREFEYDDF